MARRRLLDRLGLSPERRNTASWPDVDPNVLKGAKRARFMRLRKAVKHFMDTDRPVKEITLATQVSKSEIARYVRRCLTPTNGGGPVGFPALLERTRLDDYTRVNKLEGNGHAGRFGRLLTLYPELVQWIEDTAFGHRTEKAVAERNKATIDIHNDLLNKLSALGVGPHEYPFTVKSRGYESLRKYLKQVEEENFEKAAKANYLPKGKHLTGASENRLGLRLHRPYEWEMADTHAVDGSFVVGVLMPDGLYKPIPITRFGIMTIIDAPSRCVMGYQPMLNRDARGEDLLSAARNSVLPWRPRQLSIPDLMYPPGAGFPSGVIDGCGWRTGMRLSYDNAQAHLSDMVKRAFLDEIRCALNDGIAGVPESRGILERFFRTLESRLGHRVVSTTGSNPDDKRRRDPEAKAIRYEITLDDLLQLLDVVIATYNATPHSGIGKIAPMDYIRMALDQGDLPRIIPEEARKDFSLHKVYYQATVRGNIKTGVRPYVHLEGARYRNDVLANAGQLVTKSLTCALNTEDMRFADLFLENGKPLGRAVAQGKWGLVKHTLRQRRMVNSGPLRHLSFESGVDPIAALNRELARRATESTRAARAYAQSLLDSVVAGVPYSAMGSVSNVDIPIRMHRTDPKQTDSLESSGSWLEIGGTVIH